MSATARRWKWSSSAAVRPILLTVVMFATGAVVAAAQDATPNVSTPTGTIEAGVGDVTRGSFKAGEYNGLATTGAYFVGNLDLHGDSAADSGKALRWRLNGVDLGLDTRSVTGEIGAQGKFRMKIGFDELRRNRSDTYQTPYDGAGTNLLTLPAAWRVPTVAGSSATSTAVNSTSARGLDPAIGDAPYISTTTNSTMGALLTATPAQKALVDAAAAADVPLFHHVGLGTTREKYETGGAYSFSSAWDVTADITAEHKDGLKPMGTVSRNTGADISTIIPDVIDSHTDQVQLALNYKGQHAFVTSTYYGSFFRNNIPFISWQNWATGPAGTGTLNTISSPPANDFNQATATAGVTFSRTAKIVAFGSYARNTQNAAFLTNPTAPVVPVTSLSGLVVTTAFNAKFTANPNKKFTLVASYKFDDHDNRTPIHIYQYADAEEPPAVNANFPAGPNNPLGAVVAQNANANRPYSRSLNLATIETDYALARRQWIKAGYDFERVNRACAGAWINCADAAMTHEQSARGEWRMSAGENLNARIGYTFAARRTPDYDENAFLALVPYANVVPATAIGGATALSFMTGNGWTGWGPALGYAPTTGNMNLFFPSNNALQNALYANNTRISELVGLRRYYVADRTRQKLRSLVSWQVAEPVSFEAGLNLTADHYPTSVYGLQDARNWALDAEVTYMLGNVWSASVYYTYEDQNSTTAGNSYTANSNTAALNNGQPGAIFLSGNSCDGYTTLQQRNNNNKLDPCLNWAAAMTDRVHTAGVGLRGKALAGKLDVAANLTFSLARGDNQVGGGNWANNLLNGPGGPPTTIAAFFIPATALPTVSVDSSDLRVDGRYALGLHHSLRLAYAYRHMNNVDWMYDGMQIGAGTVSNVLPTLEQPFNYNVHLVSLSFVMIF
jgi:MtrB/PioB family decaheme-associated outer membrane protein